ncbi:MULTISPECIES: hypothetical protein [Burkholderia]|uniref:hypothetical protein n=1 Tax=Burkholderia TaxID=32008 RepID=UPI001582EEBA|nr:MULTISPECIES: hypothetical protein [Burkholderia]
MGSCIKNIGLLIISLWFISACVPNFTGEYPNRSPEQFLNDVKKVADAGDLENVEFVSKMLRVNYLRGTRKLVYDDGGRIVEGYKVEVERFKFSREYSSRGEFYYDIYQEREGGVYRVSISLPINRDVMCIASYDFIGVFDDPDKYSASRWRFFAHFHDNKSVGTRVVFLIGGDGCVSRVNILKNRTDM